METPSWFIADSACNTVESQRAEQRLAEQLAELQQMLPEASAAAIRAALQEGGDLNEVASRLLAGAAPAPAPALAMMTQEREPPSSLCQADISSDQELALAAARAEVAAIGSARGALSPTGQRLGAALQPYGTSPADMSTMTMRQLAEGPLKLTARIARTANELEDGLMGEKVVTKYVIEVRQLGFTWEVLRRYSQARRSPCTPPLLCLPLVVAPAPPHAAPPRQPSLSSPPQFVTFNEMLSIHWVDLPELPPKLFFSTECDDLAERMMQLERYLKVLTATPELALSPPVCAFLDAIDVSQFRSQVQQAAPPARQRFVPVTEATPPV